jgi:hypothetical protein
MSSPQARERWRNKRTTIVGNFCRQYGFKLEALNHGFQLRIENLVDVYPTNGRYCILRSGDRGDWNTTKDLRQIMLEALPDARALNMYDKPPEDPFGPPVPAFDTHYLRGERGNVQYNKWYQRLWRWIRRVK